MADCVTAERLNEITSTVVGAAIKIHRALGPGLLESAYLPCLTWELRVAQLEIEPQKPIPLVYGEIRIDCAYRADLIVERNVLVEVKALDSLAPIHARQLHTYLLLGDYRVGLLLNFGAMTMKEGIKRVVNRFPAGSGEP